MDGRVAVLLAIVVLAGCSVTITESGAPGTGPDSLIVDNRTATVVDVVDGDTIDVRYADGTTATIRLLGIDSPEVHVENEPAEFGGVPDTEAGARCLRAAGHNATAALAGAVNGTITIGFDPISERTGGYGRTLAYVLENGTDVNAWLIERGHARLYESDFVAEDRYAALEGAARSAGRGLWRCRSSG